MKTNLIQKDISLFDYCTFKTGGKARYFAVIKTIEDLKQAVIFAERKSLPVFVLGGGSNLLVSDEGVDGVILKMEIKGIEFTSFSRENYETRSDLTRSEAEVGGPTSVNNFRGNSENIQVITGAGETWDDLVKLTVEKGLYGLENLSYIPGTVGASAVQNIGAYGVEVKDVIDWVEVFDMKTGEIKKIKNLDCCFGYRDSFFKKSEGKNLIVIRVAYNLQKNGELKTDYKDIQEYFENKNFRVTLPQASRKDDSGAIVNDEKLRFSSSLRADYKSRAINPEATLKELRNAIIKIRKKKLPDWKTIGTVGSFFKNPTVIKEQLNKLLEKYPELPYYKSGVSDNLQFKIPLAYILDKILNLKGFKEGNVGLYKNQPLVLVNYGGRTSLKIKNFAQKIQKKVKREIGLPIDFEVVEW